MNALENIPKDLFASVHKDKNGVWVVMIKSESLLSLTAFSVRMFGREKESLDSVLARALVVANVYISQK